MYMYMYMSMCMYTTVQYVHTSVYMYLQCTSVYATVQYVHTCEYIDVCKAPTLPLQEAHPAPACKDYVHTCVYIQLGKPVKLHMQMSVGHQICHCEAPM